MSCPELGQQTPERIPLGHLPLGPRGSLTSAGRVSVGPWAGWAEPADGCRLGPCHLLGLGFQGLGAGETSGSRSWQGEQRGRGMLRRAAPHPQRGCILERRVGA